MFTYKIEKLMKNGAIHNFISMKTFDRSEDAINHAIVCCIQENIKTGKITVLKSDSYSVYDEIIVNV